jgi:hypothetical protein
MIARILGIVAALSWLWAGTAVAQVPFVSVSPNQMAGCSKAAIYDASTSGATKLVTGTASNRIYVCGFNFFAAGTVSVGLVYGTGGTCGTGQNEVTPAYQLTAQIQIVDHLPVYTGLPPVPVSNDLCLNTSAGVAVQAIVYYTQF